MLLSLVCQLAHGEGPTDTYYRIGKVGIPPEIAPEVGALTATKAGSVAACFHHGEVAIYNPHSKTWQKYAGGLHEPLGIIEERDGSLLVMQRAELTRLRDSNSDGVADEYETVWDGFGVTGNYHEFAFGPAPSSSGKLLISLNCASNADSVFREVRGPWLNVGLSREQFYAPEW